MSVPQGWRLVPEEPTEQMICAYITAIRNSRRVRLSKLSHAEWFEQHAEKCRERWRGMLAAAPSHPSPARLGTQEQKR